MIEKTDEEAIKRIVTETVNEVLSGSGLKEAAQTINDSKIKRPTKEEIMAVKNTAERQRLIRENIDLFKN